jgi:hypothetical protein
MVDVVDGPEPGIEVTAGGTIMGSDPINGV